MAIAPDLAVAEWVWRQQSIWSQTATRLKRRITRWRTLTLGLTITSAVLATLGTQVASLDSVPGKVLTWLAAVAVGTIPLAVARSGRQAAQAWTRARSVSEALKSELYSMLAGTGPYRGADRTQVLQSRAAGILADADDLAHHALTAPPAVRDLPAVRDIDSYCDQRVRPQIEGYYRPRARRLQRRLRLIQAAEMTLAVLVAALSAAAASLGFSGAAIWVPVGTTVAAALTAHAAAARYEYLLIEYSRTAAQLERLRSQRRPQADADAQARADDAFVTACEQVISIQNQGWMAKLGTESAAESIS
jgi:hypothetical protein